MFYQLLSPGRMHACMKLKLNIRVSGVGPVLNPFCVSLGLCRSPRAWGGPGKGCAAFKHSKNSVVNIRWLNALTPLPLIILVSLACLCVHSQASQAKQLINALEVFDKFLAQQVTKLVISVTRLTFKFLLDIFHQSRICLKMT